MSGLPYQEADSFCTNANIYIYICIYLANKIWFSNTAQDKLRYVVLQKGECQNIKEKVYYR